MQIVNFQRKLRLQVHIHKSTAITTPAQIRPSAVGASVCFFACIWGYQSVKNLFIPLITGERSVLQILLVLN